MNFEFSADQKMIQDQVRSFLADNCPLTAVRAVLERDAASSESFDRGLWDGLANLGWAGVSIPEQYGGLGMGYLELCVIAEELGRALAPTPFSSTVYLAAELLMLAGTDEQKTQWLPKIASGELIATVALAENEAGTARIIPKASVDSRGLNGAKLPVCDGDSAQLVLLSAVDDLGQPGFYLVERASSKFDSTILQSVDPTRDIAKLEFADCAVQAMRKDLDFTEVQAQLFDRAAVLFSFEQVGGSQACLDMAKEYTTQRYAFGRPVASFQALKHKMADMFVSIELARSNAYYGAWALSSGDDKLTEAAAVARISATEAYYECSKENMQAHGGMGYTWELDCHLYYRRAQYLASILGSQSYWKDRLMEEVA
ncbi:MAG: acyl-CoA dehydrogenase family protein [Pseudomonadales bacterium]